MRAYRVSLVAVLVLTLVGCSGRGGRAVSGTDSNRLVAIDVQGVQFRSAYEMIRALRPHWLRPAAGVSVSRPGAGEPVVYVDGVELGRLSVLTEVMASDVLEAEYMNASRATAEFGMDHAGGAILIRTKR